jgi:exosortase
MTGEDGADPSPARIQFTPGVYAALASVLITCVVLFVGIQYCSDYGVGRFTLGDMWLNTFWDDLWTQISGLFAGASKETQSGEASSGQWDHCLLVPFLVAWLVWRQWPALRRLDLTGNAHGYTVLALGFFVYLAGFLMESYYFGYIALEIIYAGLVLLFLGWPALRMLLVPIAFLMFMWPYNFMEDIALELRLYMSALGHDILQFIAVPNMLDGTAIKSFPGSPTPFAIDIADPCSGIRSLFALVMIATLYAYIAFDKFWQQLVVVALSVPLVLLGNLVRIILLALGTIHFGETFALGTNVHPSWYHEGAGYLVYFINFGGLIGIGTLLAKWGKPSPEFDEDAPPDDDI